MIQDTKTMRDVFLEKIASHMRTDKKVFFLSADFGSPKLDLIREKYKDRFINVGIAEQNLINISTGLALEGFTVYAYAIDAFLTMRAYEQIRTNLALLGQLKPLNVNLIGVGAGLGYDVSGPTHHCLESLSIVRTIPNITIFSPSDWAIAEKFFEYTLKIKTPKYLRFDGKPTGQIYDGLVNISFARGFTLLRPGKKVCLVSTGVMTHRALEIAKKFQQEGVDIGVIDIYLVRPLNESLLISTLNKYQTIITLEEAFVGKGGLDSLVRSSLAEFSDKTKIISFGFRDKYSFAIESRDDLQRLNGLSSISIEKAIRKSL